jgi:hypothetical protein
MGALAALLLVLVLVSIVVVSFADDHPCPRCGSTLTYPTEEADGSLLSVFCADCGATSYEKR